MCDGWFYPSYPPSLDRSEVDNRDSAVHPDLMEVAGAMRFSGHRRLSLSGALFYVR
ncbi:hypothetical protein CALVIDRAFT_540407 [Calocera viscosa TUFC12733]|uniref:Uncharacterized protein n=1 Tax=Calocera viscosa (strain TUFC12733) TaxID=1330018 RepID=A0A167ITF0_CALVF|nr:hypothetical protein CALVIDRAFT_540407 [Calocera viscosa TUFC12733]